MTRKLPKVIGLVSSVCAFLTFATNSFAQSATGSAATKGGTDSSLPAAGTTEITYFLFMAGVVFFVFGTLKLVASFREA